MEEKEKKGKMEHHNVGSYVDFFLNFVLFYNQCNTQTMCLGTYSKTSAGWTPIGLTI